MLNNSAKSLACSSVLEAIAVNSHCLFLLNPSKWTLPIAPAPIRPIFNLLIQLHIKKIIENGVLRKTWIRKKFIVNWKNSKKQE